MSGVDISVLVTLVVFAVIGGWKGFAWQATHLSAVVFGFLLASLGAPYAARLVGEPNPFGRSMAWFAIFILVVLTAHLLALRLKEKIAEYKLNTYDRELGAAMGALKGALLLSLVLFALAVPVSPMRAKIIHGSHSGAPLAFFLEQFHPYLPLDLHVVVHRKVRGGKPTPPGHWGGDEPAPPGPPAGK